MTEGATVVAHPTLCPVCSGDRVVEVRGPGDANEYAVVPCLGCVWVLPIVVLPMRGDR